MAQPQHIHEDVAQGARSSACRRAHPRLAEDLTGASFVASPARRLQSDLEVAIRRGAEPKWSARRTLGFVVVTNGIFWIGLAWMVRAAVA